MQLHIIYGPTAISKSKLAFSLWQQYGYPVLSVDSRKVYKGADIGTNKYTMLKFMKENPSMLVGGMDFLLPTQEVSAYIYQRQAYSWILEHQTEIETKGGLILHGGTGLYLDAFLEGKTLLSPRNDSLRDELSRLDVPALQLRAQSENLSAYQKLNDSDRMNPRRLLRVIENAHFSVEVKTDAFTQSVGTFIGSFEKVWHVMTAPRDVLYPIINARVLTYIELGWMDEIATLLSEYGPDAQALKMMGYRQVVSFVQEHPEWKDSVLSEMPAFQAAIDLVQQEHRRYAKRQETWAKKYLAVASAS